MKFTPIAFFLALVPKILLGCSCSGPDHFCKGIADDHNIVLVKVGKGTPKGIYSFTIIENLLNEIDSETIELQSSTGWNCEAPLHTFTPNDTMIFHLRPAHADTLDYSLTHCGVQYLYYSRGVVSGAISPNIEEVSYHEFKETMGSCTGKEDDLLVRTKSAIYPNPVTNTFTLESKNDINKIEVIDLVGNKFTPIFEKVDENTASIEITALPAGMYFMKIYGEETEEIVRFVKI